MTGKRWVRRPQGANWGDFGENDQLGRLNLIGPDQRRAAVLEVEQGITFSLSLPLDVPRRASEMSRWAALVKSNHITVDQEPARLEQVCQL